MERRPYERPGNGIYHALVGGPCTGKSAVIRELASRGYVTVDEAARQIIAEEQLKERGVLPSTDLAGFQLKVLDRQLELEDLVRDKIAFCDRGIVDNVGYCIAGSIPVPRQLVRASHVRRYDTVFLFDRIPYTQDGERKEDEAYAEKLHGAIAAAYQSYGYDLIRVPVMSEDERSSIGRRADFVFWCSVRQYTSGQAREYYEKWLKGSYESTDRLHGVPPMRDLSTIREQCVQC